MNGLITTIIADAAAQDAENDAYEAITTVSAIALGMATGALIAGALFQERRDVKRMQLPPHSLGTNYIDDDIHPVFEVDLQGNAPMIEGKVIDA